ncbi:hypothetical protein PpBr36_05431 [Pyricularia pennisetigena]|uniref:hypothetical protein n=1 Tax=Pyricularia pennisetigena TaxID=1578925 RepID=UPI001151FFB9|nr:hypothetical protein PpBr36_05431 [Pyricularia pennisetigena]TLS26701.1 hypothetical protein PpBr36_05431 [Pyricularia pennisetigena]
MSRATSQASISMPAMLLLALAIILAVVVTPAATAEPARCYLSGGRPIEDDKMPIRPCEWNKGVGGLVAGVNGTCCGRGQGCLVNGFCVDTGKSEIWEGGCVNRNGDFCAQDCESRYHPQRLEKCGADREDYYACPGRKDDCDDEDANVFRIRGPELPDYVILGTVSDERIATTTSTVESSRDTSTATDDPQPATTISGPAETVTKTLPVDDPQGPLPTDNNDRNQEPSHESDPSGVVPLAVGVSIGAVALVAMVLGGCWWHRDRVRREPARAETPPQTTGPIADSRDFIYLPERVQQYGRMRAF